MDYPGDQVADIFIKLGITHVVWLPDSAIGAWEQAFQRAGQLKLVRVCREGEAWAIAAGLHLAGLRPLVVIQNTGLFESGDALRNVLFDLGLPLLALIGYRNYLVPQSPDTTLRFTEPILDAWELDYVVVRSSADLTKMEKLFRACHAARRPGVVLLGEGPT